MCFLRTGSKKTLTFQEKFAERVQTIITGGNPAAPNLRAARFGKAAVGGSLCCGIEQETLDG